MQVKEGLQADWEALVERNSHDSYSKGVVDYMLNWSKAMEQEIANGKTVAEAAGATESSANTETITLAMFNMAVRELARHWVHGEELRLWHNAKWGYPGHEGVAMTHLLTANR